MRTIGGYPSPNRFQKWAFYLFCCCCCWWWWWWCCCCCGWWYTYPFEKYEFVSWEVLSHILWKIKRVPNHQPVVVFPFLVFTHIFSVFISFSPHLAGSVVLHLHEGLIDARIQCFGNAFLRGSSCETGIRFSDDTPRIKRFMKSNYRL